MQKRTLKRQLNLFQTIMLGSAGALGSGIFVLTGLAAAVAGPATVFAVILAGLLSFSIAINYSELATIYPETGGAMTYVREAWGRGLLSFVVGSMDSISSTFYTALSAVGFAYSFSIFFPAVPIIPAAVLVIILFVVLNILGVTRVGNAQIVMGAALIFAFAVFITAGFISPNGFHAGTLFPPGGMFPVSSVGLAGHISVILKTIALIYAAYVGFEVIADDAEEVKNPNRNLPLAILVSIALITSVYSLVVIVTLGVVPWQAVAGSTTALTDAVRRFLPGAGVSLIALAGMVGALSSINTSMLSATRETFTLGRDGAWPAALARLNRLRIPYVAILMIGVVSIFITVIGVVDFLSYITSAGYLFVLFFSNLAMIRLRRKYPSIQRPFTAPLFPLTPILASLTCLIVIFYSDLDAVLFTGAVIAFFVVYYYARAYLQLRQEAHRRSLSPGRWRIILPFDNTREMDGLMKLGALLAEAEKDTNMCLLDVLPAQVEVSPRDVTRYLDKIKAQRQDILKKFISYAVDRDVPMYTKIVAAQTLVDGVINEIRLDDNARLVLMKWPELQTGNGAYQQSLIRLTDEVPVNLAVLKDRGIGAFHNILVPVGGGLNSHLAVQLANMIAAQEHAHVNYMHVIPDDLNEEGWKDMISYLQEMIITQLGQVPANASLQIRYAKSIQQAVLEECGANVYELVIIGSAFDPGLQALFGVVCDEVAGNAPCSVLVVRRHESPTAAWLHQQARRLQGG